VNEDRTGYLPREALEALFGALRDSGHRVIGPRVRDGAIVFDELDTATELPAGWSDRQAPGSYRLEPGPDGRCFAWANGPQALKPMLFVPREILWRAVRDADGLRFESAAAEAVKTAVIGVRSCDVAGLSLQDKHFLHKVKDPWYRARREALLLVAVDCSHPAQTCFCASTGDGPGVTGGADLALNELDEGFLVRAYTDAGRAIRDALPLEEASAEQTARAGLELAAAAAAQTRQIPGRNLRDSLFASLDHPRWNDVAERCLSCGNCVSVCPTCFCHAEREQPSLDGSATEHLRQWDTCYSAEHSYLHGFLIRADTRLRYRQWLTHKLAGWHDQYGRSGCVGCGRCISWCPVGIDITEEAAALCAPAEAPS
jgi:ferredoxin